MVIVVYEMMQGNDQHMEMLEEQISSAEMDGMLESLAHVIEKVGSKVEYIHICPLKLFEFCSSTISAMFKM